MRRTWTDMVPTSYRRAANRQPLGTTLWWVIRRTFRLGLRVGLLAGLGYTAFKLLQRRNGDAAVADAPTWPPVTPRAAPFEPPRTVERPPARPEPSAAPAPPPQPTPPAPPSFGQAWVEPSSDGLCPQSHPIRAKLSSKIFHLPGMFAYERTKPDRCYAAEDAAVSDGFRKAKR